MKPRRRLQLLAAAAVAALLAGAVFYARHRPAPPGAPAALPAGAPGVEHLAHGRFADLAVYSPAGTPKSFVLLLSGEAGWSGDAVDLAKSLSAQGALVAGIDLPKLEKDLEADGADCVFPDGDLENLSHFVQAYYRLPTYLPPVLVGDAEGAAFAYAMLVQAPANTFAGALSVNFRPRLAMRVPLCRGSGIEFHTRTGSAGVELLPAKSTQGLWIVLQTGADPVFPIAAARAFVGAVPGAQLVAPADGTAPAVTPAHDLSAVAAAFARIVASIRIAEPTSPAALPNLPVIEIPAPGAGIGDEFAVILSGDGGWAGLDKDVAAALVARGIPVVGLDSLRYFWSPRTPQGLADDLDRMIRYYLQRFGKRRALLVGYSQGADVLPFAVNRLPAATRASVALTAVIGMSEHAVFEFHVANWISDDASGPATLPEINRISGAPVMCIYGRDETDSVCPKLDPARVRIVQMPGGHHFNGDYAGLAQRILAFARPGG